jgi:hypothetical protein
MMATVPIVTAREEVARSPSCVSITVRPIVVPVHARGVIDARLGINAALDVDGRRGVVVMMLDDALALDEARRRRPLDVDIAFPVPI